MGTPEQFALALSEISRLTGLEVRDARTLSQHELDGLTPVDDRSLCDVPAFENAVMMANGLAATRSLDVGVERSTLKSGWRCCFARCI